MSVVRWLILLIVLIGAVTGVRFLAKYVASQSESRKVGVFTMLVGGFGIFVALLARGDGSGYMRPALLLSGAIVLGCGAIATAIGKSRE